MKSSISRHVAVRIDLRDAFGHDLDFLAADGVAAGRQLAVDVAERDHVVVDQREAADTAARQRLHGPGTDAADTDDAKVQLREQGIGTVAVQALDGAETLIVVGCRHASSRPAVHTRVRRPMCRCVQCR